MPPKPYPKEFTVNMHPQNKEWFEEYTQWNNTITDYHSIIIRFLKFPDNVKPINNLKKYDVKNFLDRTTPYVGDRSSFLIPALENIKKFLIVKKGIKDNFLKGIDKLKTKPIHPEAGKAEALNLAQIGYIRKYNREEGGINVEYMFEIFFQLGIDKAQLEICHPVHKVEGENSFEIKGKPKIPYNEKIAELLKKVQANEEDFNWKFHDVDKYLEDMTDLLRTPELNLYNRKRQIRTTDLKASHKAHFIACPNCKTMLENSEKNWVLARIEGGNEFYVVCSQCKGEPKLKEVSNEN